MLTSMVRDEANAAYVSGMQEPNYTGTGDTSVWSWLRQEGPSRKEDSTSTSGTTLRTTRLYGESHLTCQTIAHSHFSYPIADIPQLWLWRWFSHVIRNWRLSFWFLRLYFQYWRLSCQPNDDERRWCCSRPVRFQALPLGSHRLHCLASTCMIEDLQYFHSSPFSFLNWKQIILETR